MLDFSSSDDSAADGAVAGDSTASCEPPALFSAELTRSDAVAPVTTRLSVPNSLTSDAREARASLTLPRLTLPRLTLPRLTLRCRLRLLLLCAPIPRQVFRRESGRHAGTAGHVALLHLNHGRARRERGRRSQRGC